ncbi:hypothetical protein K8R61_03205 [bacterium]|nr:hypothetical protein [bacterium]
MFKKIQFKLTKIKYTGKSIGDDIRVNIEMPDKFFQIDKRIKVGSTVEFDNEIESFPSDQKTFATKAKITITEKDALFNDVNNVERTIKVDTEKTKPQKFVHTIELRENRFWKNWGKSVAKFEITIEALSVETIRYVPDVSNGWLKVRIVNGKEVSLPAFLKVQFKYFERGREYFTILEGPYKNEKASVKLEDNKSWFSTGVEHQSLVHLKYSISKKTLFIDNKKYQATDHADSPWKKGWYDIELPDYPHEDRMNYVNTSSRFKTWFRIGHKGERYLHTGRASLGCITITEIEKWNEIYDKLIKARKGDFMSVGVLEVVD